MFKKLGLTLLSAVLALLSFVNFQSNNNLQADTIFASKTGIQEGSVWLGNGVTTDWKAVSFTANVSHVLTSIQVYIDKNTVNDISSQLITFSVRASTNNTQYGRPGGNDLVAVSQNGSVVDNGVFKWVNFIPTANVTILAGEKYWIVGRKNSGVHQVGWANNNDTPLADNQYSASTDGGVTWGVVSAASTFFIESGISWETGLTVLTDFSVYNQVTDSQDVQGTITATSANVTERGFQLGTTSGNYATTISENGSFVAESYWNTFTGLTAQAIYYFRAFAYNSTSGYIYGNELSFQYAPIPILTTGVAELFPYQPSLAVFLYEVPITVTRTGTNDTLTYGLLIGTSNTTLTYDLHFVLAAQSTNLTAPFIVPTLLTNLLPNTTYYYRAYAYYVDTLYNYPTGWGDIMSVTTSSDYDLSNASVTLSSAIVSGTSVVLTGSIDNTGSYPFPYRGFAWSTSDNFTSATKWSETSLLATFTGWGLGSYSHQVDLLNNSTDYYFWAFMRTAVREYIYSDSTLKQTGSTSGVTFLAPTVVTNQPSSVTANSVNASMTITSLAGVLGFAVVQIDVYGFDIGETSGVYTDFIRSDTGTYDIGNYWMSLSSGSWTDGQIIYVKAYAHNTFGRDAYGAEIPIQLHSGGVVTPISPVASFTGDFSETMKRWMSTMGMDNPTGHWASLLLLEVVFSIIFVIILLAVKEDTERKVISIVWLLVAMITFGVFTFSGLLGIWGVLILILGAIGLILLVANIFTSGGKGG